MNQSTPKVSATERILRPWERAVLMVAGVGLSFLGADCSRIVLASAPSAHDEELLLGVALVVLGVVSVVAQFFAWISPPRPTVVTIDARALRWGLADSLPAGAIALANIDRISFRRSQRPGIRVTSENRTHLIRGRFAEVDVARMKAHLRTYIDPEKIY